MYIHILLSCLPHSLCLPHLGDKKMRFSVSSQIDLHSKFLLQHCQVVMLLKHTHRHTDTHAHTHTHTRTHTRGVNKATKRIVVWPLQTALALSLSLSLSLSLLHTHTHTHTTIVAQAWPYLVCTNHCVCTLAMCASVTVVIWPGLTVSYLFRSLLPL